MGNPSTGSASISPKIKEIQDQLHKAAGPTSQPDGNHKSASRLDEFFDELALKIINKVIGVCDIFINGGKVARGVGVPEIGVADKKDVVFFLTGLAYRLADASVLRKKMVEFKELINKKQNHFKDLIKLKDNKGRDDDVALVRALMYNRATTGQKEVFRSPISLQTYPPKLDLFMKEIKTGSEKGDGNIVNVKFGEIKETAGISSIHKEKETETVKDAQWYKLIDKFQEQVANNFNNSEFMKTLVDCTGEACKAVQDSCSSELNKVINMQAALKRMAEKYTEGKLEEITGFKDNIRSTMENYKENVKNIIGKIEKGSEYYGRLSEEDQGMADQICKFLNENFKNLEKYASKYKETNLEEVVDFLDCANYINSELIVEDNADKEIKEWYNNMKIYCQKLSITLTGEGLKTK